MIDNRSHVAVRLVLGTSMVFILTAQGLAVSPRPANQGQKKEPTPACHANLPAVTLGTDWNPRLRLLLIAAINLMEGTGGTTTLSFENDPEVWMSTLAIVYAAEGIRANMTTQEKDDLLDAIDDADLHLDTAPDAVDSGDVADCETLLDDMRTELLGTSL